MERPSPIEEHATPHRLPVSLTLATWLALAALAPGASAAPASPPESAGRTVILDERPDGAATAPALVIPRAQLTAPGATLAEAAGRQPGTQTERLGGPGALSLLRVRGSTPDQVRLFLDGVDLEHADGSPADLGELPLWSAARVKLWRSHAPLSRGGAIGGALELVSLRPREPLAQVSLGAGAFGTATLRLHGAWTDPQGRGGVAAAVDLTRSDGDYPWRDDRGTLYDPTDDRSVRRQNADMRRFVGLVRGTLRAGSRCRVSLVDHALALERGLPGPAGRPTRDVRLVRTANLVAARFLCRRPGAWSWQGTAALRWSRSASRDPHGALTLAPSQATRAALAPSATTTAGLHLADWARLGLHLEAAHDRFALDDALRPAARRRVARTRGALAGEVGVLLPWVDAEVVGRGRVDAFSDVSGGGETAGAGQVAGTWAVAVAYKGLRRYGVRASAAWGTAVRQPNLYELYGDGAYVLPAPGLRPERASTASGTISWAPGFLPEGWLGTLELAGFASDVEDLIQFRRSSAQTAVASNEERALLRGFELSASLDAWSHLRLQGAHTTLWTESRSPFPARRGKPLPLRPRARSHARVEVYQATPEGHEARLYADLDHVGSNTYDPAGLVRAPARYVWSLGAGLRLESTGLVGLEGRLELGVVIRDLQDTRPVDLLGYPLPGRSWDMSLTWTEAGF